MQDVVENEKKEEAEKLTDIFSKLPEDGKNQIIGYMACLVNTENSQKEKARN